MTTKRASVVSRSQAFTRFLPGAIETIDGQTVHVISHESRGADIDDYTLAFLKQQLRAQIAQWEYVDATFRHFVEDAEAPGFEFVESRRITAQTLPLVECERCKAVFRTTRQQGVIGRCQRPGCNGRVRVVPFVEIHECGQESSMRVPSCPHHGEQFIKLERHTARRWACGVQGCTWFERAFAGYCGKQCYFAALNVDVEKAQKRKSQILVGSGSVFRTQAIDLLNPPGGDLGRLFREYSEFVPRLFLADYLGISPLPFLEMPMLFRLLDEMRDREHRRDEASSSVNDVIAGLKISDEQREQLLKAMAAAGGGLKAASRVAEFKQAMDEVDGAIPELSRDDVPFERLKEIYDITLALNLPNASNLGRLIAVLRAKGGFAATSADELDVVRSRSESFGLADIILSSNFPIVGCAYGYTRGSRFGRHEPVLRAFPKRPSVYGGRTDKTPFFVLSSTTEALVFQLSPSAVRSFLHANGLISAREALQDDRTFRAWLLRQFIPRDGVRSAVEHVVTCAVHSYSHRMLEQLALESCFQVTSLSEMVMPAALTFVLYVNQLSEFNIGGLSSFVEQRLLRSLEAVTLAEPCMFDPICTLKDGCACNGCLYLPEVTCREFNGHLTRAALHGGQIQAEDPYSRWIGRTGTVGLLQQGP
jgi:hypothetical protein